MSREHMSRQLRIYTVKAGVYRGFNPVVAVSTKVAILALAGVGRVILPTFAAASYTELHQIGPPIEEIRHEEWLVCHHDARHDPPIRRALDAFYSLLSDRNLRPAGRENNA